MDEVNEHLNTDAYLGFKPFSRNNRKQGKCHYWINRPVIPSLTLFSMFYVRNGVDAYLMHKCKNSSAWDNSTLRKTDSGWHCEARSIAKEKYKIFPVPRGYEFSMIAEDECVQDFLEVGSKKFTMKKNTSLERFDQFEWNRYQLMKRNGALMNAGHMLFKLGKKQQEILNVLDEHTRVLHDEIKSQNERLIQYAAEVEIQKSLKREQEQEKLYLEQEKKYLESQLQEKDEMIKNLVSILIVRKNEIE